MDTGMKPDAGLASIVHTTEQTEVSGLLAGTTVMTMDGVLPVEHLTAGDRVITRDCGMAILRDVTISEAEIAPIAIKAGSLGHTRPDRDTRLAPGTQVHIRDWRAEAMFGSETANVPVHRLADGEFVATAPIQKARVYDLSFDSPHIIYVDGLEVALAGR